MIGVVECGRALLMEMVVVPMGNAHCATIEGGFGGLGAKGGQRR